MDNIAFNEDECKPSDASAEDCDQIITTEPIVVYEIPPIPPNRLLYVLTYPILYIRTTCRTHSPYILYFFKYGFMFAWIGFIIAALAISESRAIPVLILTLVGYGYVIYEKCFKTSSKKFRAAVIGKCASMPWIKYIIYTIFILCLLCLCVYQTIRNPQILQSLIGVFLMPFIALCCSSNPDRIQLQPLLFGFIMQIGLGVICFKFPLGRVAMEKAVSTVQSVLSFSDIGAEFVFGPSFKDHFIAFSVMPIILYVSAGISILFYIGVIPGFMKIFGGMFADILGITPPEALTCIGSMFFGQIETLLLIGPCVPCLTKSEMTVALGAGFASISGSVLFAFIAMGVSGFDLFAATLMAVPATVLMSKIIEPETERSRFSDASIDETLTQQNRAANMMDAISTGVKTACKVVLEVMVALITFYSIIYAFDSLVGFLTSLVGKETKFQDLLAVLFFPLAFSIGVPVEDCMTVSRLIGIKTLFNEFVAYQDLIKEDMSEKSRHLATFALCGFANLTSVTIIMGAVSSLSGEIRMEQIRGPCWRGLLVGILTGLFNASVAGIINIDQLAPSLANATLSIDDAY